LTRIIGNISFKFCLSLGKRERREIKGKKGGGDKRVVGETI
jgi:hypothetical protein